jgi:hypothetical protein
MRVISTLGSCVALAALAAGTVEAQTIPDTTTTSGPTITGGGFRGAIPIWTGDYSLGTSNMRQEIPGGTFTMSVPVKGATVLQITSTAEGFAVLADAEAGTGVFASSDTGTGVDGGSQTGVGVEGVSHTNIGVLGVSSGGNGVEGQTASKYAATVGENTGTVGDGIGGIACNCSTGAAAIVGKGELAADFVGKVQVMGDFLVTGKKEFHIDHPLDPANKYLNHFAIESNEVLDTYSGNVTTDGGGTATVTLPNYFQALNTNFRYQLTVIGQFAQAIVSEEIQNNQFVIKTDKPSVKISWQVTGVRSDASVKAHPVPVEEDKSEQERGYYLTPEAFGQPEEMSIAWLHHGPLMSEAKKLSQQRQQAAVTAQ